MKFQIATVLFSLGTIAAAPAYANNAWHQTDSEIGYETIPNHGATGKTSQQVAAELAAAKSDKRQWYFTNLNAARPGWYKQESNVTRAEVIAAAQNMSPDERARLDRIYTPG
ncbi:DUF4148 domain-containing protein [Achromobacter aloeverae]